MNTRSPVPQARPYFVDVEVQPAVFAEFSPNCTQTGMCCDRHQRADVVLQILDGRAWQYSFFPGIVAAVMPDWVLVGRGFPL